MDAEDVAEEAVGGGKLIQETADFAGMGDRFGAKDGGAAAAGATAAGLLMPDELLVTADAEKDPIGFRLLRTMGWREGHGVGPRRRRAPKGTVPSGKQKPAAARSGDAAGDSGDEGDAGPDPFAADFKFAPKDVDLFAIEVRLEPICSCRVSPSGITAGPDSPM
jgi:G patch domain-containing protein 1